jgi:hypothetical protein
MTPIPDCKDSANIQEHQKMYANQQHMTATKFLFKLSYLSKGEQKKRKVNSLTMLIFIGY